MHVPWVNLDEHWPSVVKVAGNNSQVKSTQFEEAFVVSHPHEALVAPERSKLLQSEAVAIYEHNVGFVKHYFPVGEQFKADDAQTEVSIISVHLDVFGIHPKPFVTQFECQILQSESVVIDFGALVQILFE